MLELNTSLFAVSALVGILFFVLNRLYFRPVGQLIKERENKIEQENTRIETNLSEIEEKTGHIEAVLREAQKESRRVKEELIKKGEEVREHLITDARENSRRVKDTKISQLEEEIMAAEKKLEQEIGLFSSKIKEIFIPG